MSVIIDIHRQLDSSFHSGSIKLGAALFTAVLLFSGTASSQPMGQPQSIISALPGNNFSSIASNITTSIASVPGLLTGLSYMCGLLLGAMGIVKIKDHVEDPRQTTLKECTIRMAAGGALFALPIVYESMQQTIGDGVGVQTAGIRAVEWNVQ